MTAWNKRIVCCGLGFLIISTAGFRAPGGILLVDSVSLGNNASIYASQIYIASNTTLSGNGTIEGNMQVAGILSPGNGGIGTQTVSGSVGFAPASRFLCDVLSHTAIDQICSFGPITGSCEVVLVSSAGAYPVHQLIALGGAAGSYEEFTLHDTWTWRLETTGSLCLAVTHLRGDTDGDGLPDWWEIDHFAGRTNAQPLAHSDTDGMDNLSEFIANTDPLDGESVFRIVRLHKTPTAGDAVAWNTTPGRRYRLLYQTNLPCASWSTAAVITAYGEPEQEWTNTLSLSPNLIYGIAVEEEVP